MLITTEDQLELDQIQARIQARQQAYAEVYANNWGDRAARYLRMKRGSEVSLTENASAELHRLMMLTGRTTDKEMWDLVAVILNMYLDADCEEAG